MFFFKGLTQTSCGKVPCLQHHVGNAFVGHSTLGVLQLSYSASKFHGEEGLKLG